MICPDCGAEYRPGFTRCADCDVDLLDAPPGTAWDGPGDGRGTEEAPAPSFVRLPVAPGWGSIPLLRSLLESTGIPFVIKGEHTFGTLPAGRGGGFFGRDDLGVVILVPEDRLEEAEALLATEARPDPEGLPGEEDRPRPGDLHGEGDPSGSWDEDHKVGG